MASTDIRWSLSVGSTIRLWSDDGPGLLDGEDWEGGDGLVMEEAPAREDDTVGCSMSVSVSRGPLQRAIWDAAGQPVEVRWWVRSANRGIGGWRPLPKRFRGVMGEIRIVRDRAFIRLEARQYFRQVDERTWTHDDQQLRHPADTGLRRVAAYADYGFQVGAWIESKANPVNS